MAMEQIRKLGFSGSTLLGQSQLTSDHVASTIALGKVVPKSHSRWSGSSHLQWHLETIRLTLLGWCQLTFNHAASADALPGLVPKAAADGQAIAVCNGIWTSLKTGHLNTANFVPNEHTFSSSNLWMLS